MITSNRLTILAVGGGFAAGAFGTAALGDDDSPWEPIGPVQAAERDDRERERDDGRGESDRRIDGVRDDAAADVDERDDDERDDPTGGDGSGRAVPDTHSGGTDDGPNDRSGSAGNQPTGGDSAVAVSAAPGGGEGEKTAPIYDNYSAPSLKLPRAPTPALV
jgi:hypothetical protein